MASTIDNSDDDVRLNAAAVWYLRLQSDGESESVWTDFAAWLEADSANRVAFDRVETLYSDLDEAAPALESIERGDPASNVVVLAGRQRRFTPLRVGFVGLTALAASLAIFVGIRLTLVGDNAVRYATKTGEMRTVALADGTTVEMNTASTLAVTFTGQERHVTLGQGEALFRIAKDSTRPFLVTVGGRNVRDVGTVFNVLRDHARTVVTVESGKVSVSSDSAAGRGVPVLLAAGDQLAAEDGAGEAVSHVDPAQATSWRQGYLTYKEAPLSVVVADLNRYFAGRIFLTDKDAGVRRFSGVLKVDDETAVLNRLAQLLPLVVDRKDDGEVALRLKRQGD
jgi:transmembrane sensor